MITEVESTPNTAAVTREVALFIDGEFVDGKQSFAIVEPATEQIMANVALAVEEDVDRAVCSARRAFDQGPWPRMSAMERGEYLLEIANLLEERLKELGRLETRNTGLPIMFTAGGHIPRAIAHFRYFAEEGQRLIGEAYPLENAYLNIVMREPVGVVGLITPWNAPLSVVSMQTAAALACGNTCVVKPSELTPVTTTVLAEIAAEVGLPPGVLNVVHGPASPTGRSLVSHPGLDIIGFTGGSETGRQVMESAARGLKRFGCELGGKSANLIFADADFEAALDAAVLCMYANNGEVCTAGSRVLVEVTILEKFIEAFVGRVQNLRVGDPLQVETEVGPLVSRQHQQKLFDYIRIGLADGAQLLCGDRTPPDKTSCGFYVQPAVFSNVNNGMRIAREEIFGPLASIISFTDENEAIHIANDSAYGLAGYVWTTKLERALRVAQQLRVGSVSINAPMVRDIRVPFGGYKESGFGRTGGHYSMDFFTEIKTVCLPINPYEFPRLGAQTSFVNSSA